MINGPKVSKPSNPALPIAKRKKKKVLKPSEMLEIEANRKEEQLNQLRKAMIEERKLKMKNVPNSHWRSATNKKKIYGYSDMVMEHYSKESTNDGSSLPSAQSVRSVGKTGKENITQGLKLEKPTSFTPVPNQLENNFKKAMYQQNGEFNEVEQFLADIKMEKYKEIFIENGIEDKETILELNDEHLNELGLPLGHKLKILKKIKESRKQPSAYPQNIPQNLPPVQVSSETTTEINSGSLLEGAYDEEANKKEFENALKAWRDAGKVKEQVHTKPEVKDTSKNKIKSKKTVRFAEELQEEVLILNEDSDEEEAKEDQESTVLDKNKKPTTEIMEGMIAFKGLSLSKNCFLFSEEWSGSTFWNAGLISTVDHAGTSPRGSSTESQVSSVEPIDKELCWQCYKYHLKSEMEYDSLTKKSFWSMQCQANYFNKSVAKCSNSECEWYFIKTQGIIINQGWYWSSEWSNKAYELLNREPEEAEQEELQVEEFIEDDPDYEVDLS